MIWDELRRDDDSPHYPYFVTVSNAAGDFAAAHPKRQQTMTELKMKLGTSAEHVANSDLPTGAGTEDYP